MTEKIHHFKDAFYAEGGAWWFTLSLGKVRIDDKTTKNRNRDFFRFAGTAY